jgi:DNA-binding transcriptional LysR family regulator
MRLTEAGQRLFDTCQPLMQELQQAQASVLAAHEAIEGRIRISLAGQLAEQRLVPLLTQFALAHPGVELEVDLSARNVDLISEGFHLAVRMGPLESSNALVATRFLSLPWHVVASPRLLNELPPVLSPADLPTSHCLPLGKRSWDFVKGKRRFTVLPAGRFSSGSGAAVIQAAQAGLGIAHVPAYYAEQGLAHGHLQRLLADWSTADASNFYIVFPAGRHMPLRVRRLIEALQASVGDGLAAHP